MAEIKVSRRYAKSLLGLAQENNLPEQVYADMQMVASVCAASRDLGLLMRNPIIQSYKKEAVLRQIFTGKVNDITMGFLMLMISKGRVGLIEDIAREYIALYKELIGIRIAHVTSAVKLDEATRSKVMEIVRKSGGDKVELIEHIDAKLIGGFILRMDDVQYDSSVSRRLSDISRELTTNAYSRAV
jgi:F-type H+-transporting ATPase subunit delta